MSPYTHHFSWVDSLNTHTSFLHLYSHRDHVVRQGYNIIPELTYGLALLRAWSRRYQPRVAWPTDVGSPGWLPWCQGRAARQPWLPMQHSRQMVDQGLQGCKKDTNLAQNYCDDNRGYLNTSTIIVAVK